jgi:hypothetical protein
MEPIDYEVGAEVHLLVPPSAQGSSCGGHVIWKGTLSGAVRYVMAMRDEDRAVAAIALDRDAGLGGAWLELRTSRRSLVAFTHELMMDICPVCLARRTCWDSFSLQKWTAYRPFEIDQAPNRSSRTP